MCRCRLLAILLLAQCAHAVTLDVARLPEPAFADREVSADAALPAGRTNDLRTFRLEMTFDAIPSNNVQAAFGRDAAPADGCLDAGETDFIIGWDCGEWFLRPRGLRERHAFAPAVQDGTRTLTVSIRMSSQGALQSPVMKDGGTVFTFPGLQTSPFPDWLNPGLWTHLRVTARGADAPGENIKAVFAPGGARISIR